LFFCANALAGLNQTGGTLASCNAHGHNTITTTGAFQLTQNATHHPRARHTEGVTDGDTAAIHVVLGIIDIEEVPAVEALRCKRLV
jgi:hypothetical protein